MTLALEIRIDTKEVEKALDDLGRKAGNQALQKAVTAAAKFLKPKVKAETPKRTGALRKSVGYRAAKKGRPGSVVLFKSSVEHLVIGGTRAHSTKLTRALNGKKRSRSQIQAFSVGGEKRFSRGHDVAGARPNPIISRVTDRWGEAALDIAEEEIAKQLGLDK